MEPCDHIKGLECNFGSGDTAKRGICRAKSEGMPCDFGGNIYQNGENFQPNCKHQCTCIDGVVGCLPLCPQELSLPPMDCAKPRLVKIPGQCCEEWACDTNHIGEDSGDSNEEGEDSMSCEEDEDQPDAEPLSSNELTDLVRGGLKIEPGTSSIIYSQVNSFLPIFFLNRQTGHFLITAFTDQCGTGLFVAERPWDQASGPFPMLGGSADATLGPTRGGKMTN
ncbi:hypothetical protein chiPu_0024464 [Chiloscyllium punctatum]|uniref:VWFC domain-containing protein n=1 Tax=Chiloscyllium punctatum TaxID=137246 RepID=A0A401TDA8_CHIPU|nr:hypothetical protein [Chiloscyllium punctatum]